MSEEVVQKKIRRRRRRTRNVKRAAVASICVNQEGGVITKEEWLELRSDESYRTIKQYENEKILCLVEWHGVVPARVADPLFVDSWPVFKVKSFNKKSDGSWSTDPIYTSDHYTKDSALGQYETLLLGYTESETETVSVEDYNKEGDLVVTEKEVVKEVGNIRSPEALKKAEFNSHYSEDESAGSW